MALTYQNLRTKIPHVVRDDAGVPVRGASVNIYTGDTGTTNATVYAGEDNDATLNLPVYTDQDGRVPGWVTARGRYQIAPVGETARVYDANAPGAEIIYPGKDGLMPYSNGFKPFNDAGILTPYVTRDTNNLVQMGGYVDNTPGQFLIFTLPSGWRPTTTSGVIAASVSSAGQGSFTVEGNGQVRSSTVSCDWLSLGGVGWIAEQ